MDFLHNFYCLLTELITQDVQKKFKKLQTLYRNPLFAFFPPSNWLERSVSLLLPLTGCHPLDVLSWWVCQHLLKEELLPHHEQVQHQLDATHDNKNVEKERVRGQVEELSACACVWCNNWTWVSVGEGWKRHLWRHHACAQAHDYCNTTSLCAYAKVNPQWGSLLTSLSLSGASSKTWSLSVNGFANVGCNVVNNWSCTFSTWWCCVTFLLKLSTSFVEITSVRKVAFWYHRAFNKTIFRHLCVFRHLLHFLQFETFFAKKLLANKNGGSFFKALLQWNKQQLW